MASEMDANFRLCHQSGFFNAEVYDLMKKIRGQSSYSIRIECK